VGGRALGHVSRQQRSPTGQLAGDRRWLLKDERYRALRISCCRQRRLVSNVVIPGYPDPFVEHMPDIIFAERVAAPSHNRDRDPSGLAKPHDRIGMALTVFLSRP
jgi:hypothetical protein